MIAWVRKYATAATRPAAGSVTTQATTMLPATPQRTADSRRVAPTPMIEAVGMCVVDTGTANTVAGGMRAPQATGLGGEAFGGGGWVVPPPRGGVVPDPPREGPPPV